jgi:hypothetical protein
MRVIG